LLKPTYCSPVFVGSGGGDESDEDDGNPPDEGVPKKISLMVMTVIASKSDMQCARRNSEIRHPCQVWVLKKMYELTSPCLRVPNKKAGASPALGVMRDIWLLEITPKRLARHHPDQR